MKPYTWRAAILKSDLRPTIRHVLLTLSCYVNDVGQSAYPSTKTLASDTGLSERAVITSLQDAAAAGWLKIRKHGFGGQKWARNEYYPSTPAGDFDTEGAEAGSVPQDKKALNLLPKGTEPNDKKALNEVQSNYPLELSSKKTRKPAAPSATANPGFSSIKFLTANGATPESAKAFVDRREGHPKGNGADVYEALLTDAGKCGMSLQSVLDLCAVRGWASFEAEWITRAAPASIALARPILPVEQQLPSLTVPKGKKPEWVGSLKSLVKVHHAAP